MDPIVHFEIPVQNLAAAKSFYASIFGWKLQDWKLPDGSLYVGAHTTPIDEVTRLPLKPGAINGGIMERTDRVTAPVIAVHVDSIDDRLAKITVAGGSLVIPKHEVMGMGYYAYVSDPSGNILGLWEDKPKA